MNTPLINATTLSDILLLVKSPASCVMLIGEKGSGKTHLAQYIITQIVKHTEIVDALTIIDGSLAGIDEIRELQRKLSLTSPGQHQYRKVLIIEHLDLLSIEAQNALLKTLEEPPTDALIFITVSKPKQVLPTIFSRVNSLVVRTVTYQEVTDYYGTHYSNDELSKSFNLAAGSPGLIDNLLRDNTEHPLVEAVTIARSILALPKYAQLAQIDEVIKNKIIKPTLLLDGMIRLLNAAYVAKLNQASLHKKEVGMAHSRLKHCLQTADFLDQGLSQKLALSRLFLSL